jgi:hypothetical protein
LIDKRKKVFKKKSYYIYIYKMPPKNYGWSSAEEMMKNRKTKDNIQKKVAYWRKKYNFDLVKSDHDTFIKYIHVVKKVYLDLERFLEYDKDKQISDNEFHFYAINYDKLKLVQDNKEYLQSLKRITPIATAPIILTF